MTDAFADALSVGHQPPVTLAPKDEALFRSFQANLLSLISHELRTPLTGILNALTMLDSGEITPEFSASEMISMARRNAQRLNATLSSLLDLAALESGTFHARLREVDLERLVRARLHAHESLFRDRGLEVVVSSGGASGTRGEHEGAPLLADPQRLGRALDLCCQVVIPRAEQGSKIHVRISSAHATFSFELQSGLEGPWEQAWTQALAGFQGGVASPASAFSGVLQSEQAFLTRIEEGLGSEFLLIHEIMRLHRGRFHEERDGRKLTLTLELPELSSEEGLRAVLGSRAFQISNELGSVALALVQIPEGAKIERFRAEVRKSLFRTTDAVYSLPERGLLAIVLDDCKLEDAPRLLQRIEKSTGRALAFGIAHCPSEGADPEALLHLSARRLAEAAARAKS